MNVIEGKKRKERSDRKHDIKPTIPFQLRETICRLSYITDTPIKDVGEYITELGLESEQVLDYLSKHFKRDFNYKTTFYIGDLNVEKLTMKNINKQANSTTRITIRFKKETYEYINKLAFSLDVTPSMATALVLDASMRHSDVVNKYIKTYLKERLNGTKMKELKKILSFINDNNPYDKEVTWAELLSYIYDEIKSGANTITNTIHSWLDKK